MRKSIYTWLIGGICLISTPAFSQTISRVLVTATKPYGGIVNKCELTIRYVTGATFSHRTLIVVEGFEPGHITRPEEQDGETNLNSFVNTLEAPMANEILTNYDIVYVNWQNGTDFIQRNAFALEAAITRVNTMKATAGVTLTNVVIGQSMGGLIARYALRDMENNSLQHGVELFISHDAPYQGANVPQGFQHFERHAKDLYVRTGATVGIVETVQFFRNRVSPMKVLTLSDQPAARQMLYNFVNGSNVIDNAMHTAWQTELNTMGYPTGDGVTPFRKVAVSNGAECAAPQTYNAGATLFSYLGKGNTRLLGDIAASSVLPIAGIYAGQPALVFLGVVPGKNEFEMDFAVNAQADGSSNQVYRGKIVYKKKILWTIPVQSTLTNRTYNSSASNLALDHVQGGFYDIITDVNDANIHNNIVKYQASASIVDGFSFVPTPSALDIGHGNLTLTKPDYLFSYSGTNPPASPKNSPFDGFITAFNNGINNNNEQHISFDDRNSNWIIEELGNNIAHITTANCQASCANGNYAINGISTLCLNQTYTVANLPPGTTVNWTVTPANIVQRSTNGNSITLTKITDGNIQLSANVTSACQIAPVDVGAKSITVGFPPFSGSMNGPTSVYQNASYYYSVNLPLGLTGTKNWIVSSGWSITGGQGTNQATVLTGTANGTVTFRITNCNISRDLYKNVTTDGGGTPLRTTNAVVDPSTYDPSLASVETEIKIAPNPSRDRITVTLHSNEALSMNYIRRIRITDVLGVVKREYNLKDGVFQQSIGLDNIAKGVYIVYVATSQGAFSKKIIVQ